VDPIIAELTRERRRPIHNKASHPEQDVEPEDEVFDAAADFVAFVLIPRHVGASSAREGGEKHTACFTGFVCGGEQVQRSGESFPLVPLQKDLTAGSGSASGACRDGGPGRVHTPSRGEIPKAAGNAVKPQNNKKKNPLFSGRIAPDGGVPLLREVVADWLRQTLERLRMQPIVL